MVLLGIALFVVYVFGLGVCVYFSGRYHQEDFAVISILWPAFFVMAILVFPFIGVYELGKRSRRNAYRRKKNERR